MVIDKNELIVAYIDKKLSTRKCAEIFGTNHTRIQEILDEYNIPKRRKKEAQKGKKFSEETRLKMSLAKKGKPISESLRKSVTGIIPKSKFSGHKNFNCFICGKECFDKPYRKHMYCSIKCRNLSKGEQHINYKGLMSRGEQTKRNWKVYKDFKKEVHIRDKCMCLCCGSKMKLEAHHLIPWSKDEKLRFDSNNAITLCKHCHRELHNYCGQKKIDLVKQDDWIKTYIKKGS